MKTSELFKLVLVLTCLAGFTVGDGFKCNQVFDGDAFFTLEFLSKDQDYKYYIKEKNITIYFNFCVTTKKTCPGEKEAYAVAVLWDKATNNETCKRLTGDSAISGFSYNLINQQRPEQGLELNFNQGDIYDQFSTYNLTYKLLCDRSQTESLIIQDIINDKNEFLITAKTPNACPLIQVSAIWSFIGYNDIVFGILLLIIGLGECVYGLRLLNPTLFIIGYFTGFGLLVLLFAEFIITPSTHVILVWVALLFAVVCGALVGYLAMTLPKVGFFALGMWLGFVISLMMNNAFLYKIETNPPQLVLYLTMFILGLLFGMISCCIWKRIVIFSTAFTGAYAAIRAISLWAGYYPNELALSKTIKYKQLNEVPWQFYLYFIFTFTLGTVGTIFQWKSYRKMKKENVKNIWDLQHYVHDGKKASEKLLDDVEKNDSNGNDDSSGEISKPKERTRKSRKSRKSTNREIQLEEMSN